MRTIFAAVLAAWMAVPAGAAVLTYSFTPGKMVVTAGGQIGYTWTDAPYYLRLDEARWGPLTGQTITLGGRVPFSQAIRNAADTYYSSGELTFGLSREIVSYPKLFFWTYSGGAQSVSISPLGSSLYAEPDWLAYSLAPGRWRLEMIDGAVVPLPASAPLLAAALGALGLMRRRFKRASPQRG